MDNDVVLILDKIINLLISLSNCPEKNPETVTKIAEQCEIFIHQLRTMVNEMYSENKVEKQENHLQSLVQELHSLKGEIVNHQENLKFLEGQIKAVEAEIEEKSRELVALNVATIEKERKQSNYKHFLDKYKAVALPPKKKFVFTPRGILVAPSAPSKDIVLHLTPTLESVEELIEDIENPTDTPRSSTASEDISTECLDGLDGLNELDDISE